MKTEKSVVAALESIYQLHEIHEAKLKKYEKLVTHSLIKQEEFDQFKNKSWMHCKHQAEKLLSPFSDSNDQLVFDSDGLSLNSLQSKEIADLKRQLTQANNEVSKLQLELALNKSLNNYLLEEKVKCQNNLNINNNNCLNSHDSNKNNSTKAVGGKRSFQCMNDSVSGSSNDDSNQTTSVIEEEEEEEVVRKPVLDENSPEAIHIKRCLLSHLGIMEKSAGISGQVYSSLKFIDSKISVVADFQEDHNVTGALAKLFMIVTENIPNTREKFGVQDTLRKITWLMSRLLNSIVDFDQRKRRVNELLAVEGIVQRLIEKCPQFACMSLYCVKVLHAVADVAPEQKSLMLQFDIYTHISNATLREQKGEAPNLLDKVGAYKELKPSDAVPVWPHVVRAVQLHRLVWAPVHYLNNLKCCGVICENHEIVCQSVAEPTKSQVVVELFSADKVGGHSKYVVVSESVLVSFNGFEGENESSEWSEPLLQKMHAFMIEKHRRIVPPDTSRGEALYSATLSLANEFLRLALEESRTNPPSW